MRLVFFDLETSGLDPLRHEIVQIGAVATDYALTELARFEVKVQFNPARAEKEALERNHWDPDVWAESAVPQKDALTRFANLLRDFADVPMMSKAGRPYKIAQLVGQNASTFDGPFLQAAFKANDLFLPGTFRVLDTLQRVLWHFHENPQIPAPKDFQLSTLAEHFGIPLEGAHDALADVLATVAVYRCIGRKSGADVAPVAQEPA